MTETQRPHLHVHTHVHTCARRPLHPRAPTKYIRMSFPPTRARVSDRFSDTLYNFGQLYYKNKFSMIYFGTILTQKFAIERTMLPVLATAQNITVPDNSISRTDSQTYRVCRQRKVDVCKIVLQVCIALRL